MRASRTEQRRKVAKEAASLIYFGIEKEYKQAKVKAADALGVKFLPTNIEVAVELDKIADEYEGKARRERLIKMRREALEVMKLLAEYHPIVVGSVWRGTIHHQSDVDVIVFNDKPEEVLKTLEKSGLKIVHAQKVTAMEKEEKRDSLHIFLESPTKEEIEVIVRSPEERLRKEKCDVYGDFITGLNVEELEKLLKDNPTKRFVPF
ncbi:MAG: nucleotidyltransferase domain-containing protein [Candidatus Bathyarchaeales archaeon]